MQLFTLFFLRLAYKIKIIDKKDANYSLLKLSIEEIKKSLSNFEINSVEEALHILKAYNWDQDILACIEEMIDSLNIFDYDNLEDALNRIDTLIRKK